MYVCFSCLVGMVVMANISDETLGKSARINGGFLNEDILKITILKTNTLYLSRRYGVFVPALTKRPQKIKDQYTVSRGLNTPYSRYGINIIFWKISNVVPTPRNPPITSYQPLDTRYRTGLPDIINRKLKNGCFKCVLKHILDYLNAQSDFQEKKSRRGRATYSIP
ncbi:hypothetical protein Tco_0956988 [Tanacetum coccineum]